MTATATASTVSELHPDASKSPTAWRSALFAHSTLTDEQAKLHAVLDHMDREQRGVSALRLLELEQAIHRIRNGIGSVRAENETIDALIAEMRVSLLDRHMYEDAINVDHCIALGDYSA